MVLNFFGSERINLKETKSLLDVTAVLLRLSIEDNRYLLDSLQTYSFALGYRSLDDLERVFVRRPHGDRFLNSLGNIQRRYLIEPNCGFEEASDLDAAIVITGLMRLQSLKPVREILQRLPFTRRFQPVFTRYEIKRFIELCVNREAA